MILKKIEEVKKIVKVLKKKKEKKKRNSILDIKMKREIMKETEPKR